VAPLCARERGSVDVGPGAASAGLERQLPEVEGVRHRFVDVRGLRMHVAEAGPPEGATVDPILMLHGWPQHWYEWRHLIPRLAKRHRVICPDLRGLGWSEAPPRGYDKESLADDVLGLLEELGLERVFIVGHDWGGWIGFLICLRRPELVRRFLALNIAHPFVRVAPRPLMSFWRFWYQFVLAAPGLGTRAASGASRLHRPVTRWVGADAWTEEDAAIFLSQFEEPDRARASQQIYRSFLIRDLPAALYGRYRRMRLVTPTLLLFGTGDRVLRPHNLRGYERCADDMRVELAPGIGHHIADEAPELVAERALELFGAD
jgi:pimeloyl-ACP methyl ester carboxylesterase